MSVCGRRYIGIRCMVVVATGALISMGGCPRPDDAFEPNDTIATATVLTLDEALVGVASQFNNDVFSVEVSAGDALLFKVESLDHDVCPLFTLSAPDETVLYAEPSVFCRNFEEVVPETQVGDASLTILPDQAFEIRVTAEQDGPYYLTIFEGSHADNLFTFSWNYQITASVE